MNPTPLLNLLTLIPICSAAILLIRDQPISLPDDYIRKGNLLCKQASWTTFIAFYFGNYVAHLATIRFPPGATLSDMAFISMVSLTFPALGVAQGVQAIFKCAMFWGRKSSLDMAAHAGALCMVVRSEGWEPPENKILTGILVPNRRDTEQPLTEVSLSENPPASISARSGSTRVYRSPVMYQGFKMWEFDYMGTYSIKTPNNSDKVIHGSYHLRPGYRWETVPHGAKVYPIKDPAPEGSRHEVSSSYSLVKAGASLVQTVYATLTLYHARGDQIDRYGCAAFGLTVAPYAIMSFVNLIGSLVTPEYSALYMVSSEVMDEAIADGGFFEGVVGTLKAETKTYHGPPQYTGTFSRTEPNLVFKGRPMPGNHRIQTGPTEVPQEVQDALPSPLLRVLQQCFRVINLFIPKTSDAFCDDTIYIPNHPDFECTNVPKIGIIESNLDSLSELLRLGMLPYSPQYYTNTLYSILSCLPLAVVGALSGFQAGNSTVLQRLATMFWLAAGTYLGLAIGLSLVKLISFLLGKVFTNSLWTLPTFRLPIRGQVLAVFVGIGVVTSVPIGGFIVVGQMLKEFGECTRV